MERPGPARQDDSAALRAGRRRRLPVRSLCAAGEGARCHGAARVAPRARRPGRGVPRDRPGDSAGRGITRLRFLRRPDESSAGVRNDAGLDSRERPVPACAGTCPPALARSPGPRIGPEGRTGLGGRPEACARSPALDTARDAVLADRSGRHALVLPAEGACRGRRRGCAIRWRRRRSRARALRVRRYRGRDREPGPAGDRRHFGRPSRRRARQAGMGVAASLRRLAMDGRPGRQPLVSDDAAVSPARARPVAGRRRAAEVGADRHGVGDG